MAFNFKSAAQKAVAMSDIMTNRTKINTYEIIKNYPNGITLNNFDMIINADNAYPVFTFKENDSVYYNGGTALKKIVEEWLSAFEGNVEKCADEFSQSEGLKIKLKEIRTKSGRNFTAVEVI